MLNVEKFMKMFYGFVEYGYLAKWLLLYDEGYQRLKTVTLSILMFMNV